MNKLYHVREFAALAGITVRALHHYDRLGLLQPQRTAAGHRLYCDRDMERLEQIVALKFLGIPLKQIKALLDQKPQSLPDALRTQRRALEEKRRCLNLAIDAIREAEASLKPGKRAESTVLKKIIEVIEMQNSGEQMKKYFTDSAWATLADRREQWTAEDQHAQEKGSQAWADLFRDIEASMNEDPAGPKAQILATRWKELVDSFTGGDPQIHEGLKKAWEDRPNWSSTMQQQSGQFQNPKVFEFIQKAAAARSK